jgi:ABC-2 type transport system ATP-binding protein
MDASQATIDVTGVTKRFRPEAAAVDDLSFTVAPGQVCGLLGPNGAGKTTTLRVMLGLVHPNAGSVSILGERIRPGHPVLHRVGALVERPSFVPHLSGMTNLRLYWKAGGGRWPAPGLDRALAIAGLGSDVGRKVKTYSQGMRQRLGIAQALLGEPHVLVLDEPTNGLDPGEMREMRDLLRTLAGTGVTTLLSSHLLFEVEQVCSHAVVMDHGKLVASGTVAELAGSATGAYLEVDDAAAARRILSALDGVLSVVDEGPGLAVQIKDVKRSALVAALVHGGVAVESVTSRHRLEDAFLDMVGGTETGSAS